MDHVVNEQGGPIQLLTPAEVAAQLGVSRTWLYDAARAGRIPSIRVGGEQGPLRFVAEDLQRWIDEARSAWSPGRPACPTGSLAWDHGDVVIALPAQRPRVRGARRRR